MEGVGWELGRARLAQIDSESARLYVICQWWNEQRNFFLEWEGQLHRDLQPPILLPLQLPDSVAVGDSAIFRCQVEEDDTLYQVRLLIDEGQGQIEDFVLVSSDSVYHASWQVPHAGRFWYRIEGEDFWENVGSYPDTGWATFITEGWIDAVDNPHPIVPSSIDLSIYPNPSNATVVISLDLPSSVDETRIRIYGLLGQCVHELTVNQRNHHVEKKIDVSALASGVYFIGVANGTQNAMKKMVVLR
jgi:hypothetical protein